MPNSKVPIPASYWVIRGKLLAGEYPGSRDVIEARQRIGALLDAGINTFIDLTYEWERPPYLPLLAEKARSEDCKLNYQRFQFPDFGIPPQAAMHAALDAIDVALDEGRKVYLHCLGGIGRTGMTVGCYLVRHGRSGPQALSKLASLYQNAAQNAVFPHSPENQRQIAFILEWKE
jgi:protein-tyrosine phosphatase